MPDNGGEKMTQALDLNRQSQMQEKQENSENLSKNLVMQLMGLIKEVTKDEVSPGTVNAACNCASEIHKILKLNYQMKKDGL